MKYNIYQTKQTHIRAWKWLFVTVVAALLIGIIVVIVGARYLSVELQAVSDNTQTQNATISAGMSTSDIGKTLHKEGLIRSEWAFSWYVRTRHAAQYLQAGTYAISPSQTTQQIVSQLTHGKVATDLVTIAPGLRIDQIRTSLIKQGYTAEVVDAALAPAQYENMSVLADKPKGSNLEGYLYPDSFQRTSNTKLKTIIEESLLEMDKHLTADIRTGFKSHNLTVYQGITLASIVEQEVTKQSDRTQAAQVFLKRISLDMPLGSDVTAFYGSELAGAGKDVTYDSPYNTRLHAGLPPTPISNVSERSLDAVAHPANTDWLFFVAGDDGTTYFSNTQAEHDALTAKYCHKLCQ